MFNVLAHVDEGRMLFAGYNDHTLRAWDTLKVTGQKVHKYSDIIYLP